MKCMELWSPRVVLPNEFSSDDIDNIRMLYANQLFFHPTNKMLQTEVEEVVLNWFNPVSVFLFFFSYSCFLIHF